MKHLMTLLALVVAVTAEAQTIDWNPDSDDDSLITVEDLMALLSAFGTEFDAEAPITEYFETVKDYYTVYDGTSSCCSIHVPNDCRHLTLAGWNQGSPTSTLVPIRLPIQGMFINQIIEIRLTEVWNMNGSISIEAFMDGSWQSIGSLADNPTVGAQQTQFGYLSNDLQNERVTWNGSAWESIPFAIGELGWTTN